MLRIDRVVTSGVFTLDGQSFDVDNNVWLLGDDEQVVVVDAAHDAAAIVAGVGGRRVRMIVATHAHNDHVNVALEVADALHAPVALHPDDAELWSQVHDRSPDLALGDGQVVDFAGSHLTVLHTPGHSPGGVCLHVPDLGTVFSGDTLFQGGPGATGRSFSDFPTIVESIRTRLLTLPAATVVRTGHGDTTTIGAEAPFLDEWIARGH
ncbi:MAG TPA: MBL fold metallo-hydrolase [Acidimicrobiales bacterium]|nr:MBL fold metallo-hydrolase [Acidimicrobiales bacterium]